MLDTKYIIDIMEKICNTPSPSGYTEKAMKVVEEELLKLGMPVSYNNKGNLTSYIKGRNDKVKKAIAAHIDTLGAMVKEINMNGHIVLSPVGGFTGGSIECENCTVHTHYNKEYSGTIYLTKPSLHIHSDARTLERSIQNMELVLDEKVDTDEEVLFLGIDIGDFISFDSRFRLTESGFIKSRHLDDKAGVAIILGVCKFIKSNNIVPEDTIQIFISSYEEVGHGASTGFSKEVEELICVDMGAPGIGQNSDEYSVSICAKDSSGPYDYNLRKQLVNLAKANNIDYKVDIYPLYSSDGSSALHAGADIRVALIGPGVYASHTYERTHVDSVINTAKLLIEYIKSN